jgi:D-alanyl-D-alanine dipeptidase
MKYNNKIEYHTTNVMPLLTIFLLAFFISFHWIISSSSTIPEGFVYVRDIIPDIQISLRYASNENFQGHIVNGYLANVSILTRAAAMNLKHAQILAKENGYELVIYDGYRPQKSVNQFIDWSQNPNISQIKKSFYYPRVNKEDTFQLGYIANKSGHTRGSTIDLTLILLGQFVQNPLTPIERNLTDNFTIFYLDDRTVDMGSSFDLFDEASHTNSTLVNTTYQERRTMFRNLMKQSGFINYDKEWWHYTLQNEPFPDTYFDFDIQSSSSATNKNQKIFSVFIFLFFLIN